ncbi:Histone deacetylase 11 [Coccomyxa sp. Obi]|nr:Histone deacetylase 11 [Coccomyxa sp. Obi]
MSKYRLTRLALEADTSIKGLIEIREAPLATEEELALAHDPSYVQRFFSGQLDPKEMRSIGFPWSQGLVSRARASAGGTLAATRALLEWHLPLTANIAGGTHHAFADRGEGFCVFNDIAVSAHMAMAEQGIERVLVIDLDVHQGNGTSAIFAKDDRVTTFDVHGDKNYPWKTRTTSTYDIALPDGTGDEEYLRLLEDWLPRLFANHRPQLVFYQAGVDAMESDSFGRLSLTRRGLRQRNRMVLSKCIKESVPTVITMGGGYSRPIGDTVEAHADVHRTAIEILGNH